MPARRGGAFRAAPTSPFQRIQDQLKWVDLVFEVRDARLPESSGHPRARQLFGGKPRVIVLAKKDLADQQLLQLWLKALCEGPHQQALALSLKQAQGRERLINLALALTVARRDALKARGLLPRPMRACVVGMPNVGKSSLVNWLIGRRKTLVGDRPGVTRGTQWVRLHEQLELMDTPGILPHTALPEAAAMRLSLLNLLPEKTYDPEEVAARGMALLESRYPGTLEKCYRKEGSPAPASLEDLARARNCLGPGGLPDRRRAASLFLGDLREGKLGLFTLDPPPAGAGNHP